MKKSLLFVCVENSNRSQMAEAFANIHGKDIINAYSAGSNPSGIINSQAIVSMKEIGYDLSIHKSKSILKIPYITYDYLIMMGCEDKCPYVKAKFREDWNIPDPKSMNETEFRELRDLIERKVIDLLKKIDK